MTDQLMGRYPLISRLSVVQEGDAPPERLLPFVGIFLSAMDAPPPTPLCFVLPRRGELARLAAVLFGLHRFVAGLPQLARFYGEARFKDGDRVRIHPSRHVFIYGGFDQQHPEFIRLHALDRDGVWLVRADEFLLRLEKTTLTRPIGRLNSPIHSPAPADLDLLLGTLTFGNLSLTRNEVVILDSQAGFRDFACSWSLRTVPDGPQMPMLASLVPFGDLSACSGVDGQLFRKWDLRNPSGEPLIAISHSSEQLAAACVIMPERSRLIVVNGLSRVRDLQAFDDISQRQPLVLFADQVEDEAIQALSDRGCRFWWLTDTELGVSVESRAPRFAGLFGKVGVWACNRSRLVLDAEPCENPQLDESAIALETCDSQTGESVDGPLNTVLSHAWRMLNDAACIVDALSAEESQKALARVETLRREMRQNEAYLPPNAGLALSRAADRIAASVASGGPECATKGPALCNLLQQTSNAASTCALIVRRESQVLELSRWLSSHGFSTHASAYTVRTLPQDVAFDRIICVSWPGADVMRQIVSSLSSPHVTLLGYAFERRWLGQCSRRIQFRQQRGALTVAEKSAVVLHEKAPAGGWLGAELPAGPDQATGIQDVGIWRFEQRLRGARKGSGCPPLLTSETVAARYVGFVGETYAFLTETHRVVVATGLLSARDAQRQRLPERLAGDLREGDFVVFPESGERELIQEKADQLLGADAPALRKTAHLWKEALWARQLSPESFLKEACELRRPRHIATIRNWYADTAQIGPGTGQEDTSEDLELIALITGFAPLRELISEVMGAIAQLRSAHLSAGSRIRDALLQHLPQVVGLIEEDGTKVDLGDLGSAWIVQVEVVAPDLELRSKGEVNRLLRESSTLDFVF